MPLRVVTNLNQVRANITSFNRDAASAPVEARRAVRHGRVWIGDPASGLYGPSRFVGYEDMSFGRWKRSREKDQLDGRITNAALARCGVRKHDLAGNDDFLRWGQELLDHTVFDGVNQSKWTFLTLGGTEMVRHDWSCWSPWVGLEDKSVSEAPRGPGTYVLRCLAADGVTPQAIQRCSGIDHAGWLDVGESEVLRSRLSKLRSSLLNPDRSGHMAGWRFRQLEMERVFPLERLQLRWRTAASKPAAYRIEGALLQRYVAHHLELPPLNYKFNWSRD